MITKDHYKSLRNKYDYYHKKREELFGYTNCLTKEMQSQLPESPTHAEISSIETYEFVNDPPEKYFAYIKEPEIGNMGEMTTWTGEQLGRALLWNTWRSNFGDTRVSIDVWGINGKKYHGFYYKSAGDYCRITAYKNQE
ncbi:MAG: hypothetical protein ACXACY_27405 [Candidatus Hodarchaeales archaeon]|jgi:hypothetical protein